MTREPTFPSPTAYHPPCLLNGCFIGNFESMLCLIEIGVQRSIPESEPCKVINNEDRLAGINPSLILLHNHEASCTWQQAESQ